MATRFDRTEDAPRPADPRRSPTAWLTVVHGDPPRVLRLGRRLAIGRDPGDGLAVDDRRASRQHCALRYVPEYGVYFLKDEGSRNGTFVDGARVEEVPLAHGSVLRVGDTLLVLAVDEGGPAIEPTPTVSLGRARAENLADRVAPEALPVLVVGPTGAGKELVARRIHERSGRSGPLVPVNCGAFGAGLIQSELFGHVRGAFSGAHADRDGLFVRAAGGTLFLDEVGALAPAHQAALLRALQEKTVRPVGSDVERPVDVRVVAATQAEALEDPTFRPDLQARLAGLRIDLPGLSERREEVLPLFGTFLGDGPELTTEAAEALLLHDWPTNVRGVQALANRLRLFAEHTDEIQLSMLPIELRATRPAAGEDGAPDRARLQTLLGSHGGNVAAVARALGQHRQQVYRWLRAHDLDPAEFRR